MTNWWLNLSPCINQAIKCGAESKMAAVEMKVAAQQIQRHNRSMTSAANFHSFFTSVSSSSCFSLLVIFFNSPKIAINSLPTHVSKFLDLSMSLFETCWVTVVSWGTLNDTPRFRLQTPFSAWSLYSSSGSNRFGNREWVVRSWSWTSPSRWRCRKLWRRLCRPGRFIHRNLANAILIPNFTCNQTRTYESG